MVYQGYSYKQKPSHKPTITAHLAQTMSLLGMNHMELAEKIEGELSENPALELIEENRCPVCHRKLGRDRLCPKCSFSAMDEPLAFISARRDLYTRKSSGYENSSFEEFSADYENLSTYILRQIATELSEKEPLIAAHILTSLDDDGFLSTTVFEIARYLHVPPSQVERVLDMVQRSEPAGVGTTSPQEAMLVQASILAEHKQIPPYTLEAINQGMKYLSKKQYDELAELLEINVQQVEAIVDFIVQNLNPFPTRAHWGNQRHRAKNELVRYQNPDAIINFQKIGEETKLKIEVLWPIRGNLRINQHFLKAMKDAPEAKQGQWQKDIDNAHLLVKCLNQRNHTMVRLMQKIAMLQKEYILNGAEHMRPITRAQLAEELEVHESTISRAVSGKTAMLPSGQIVPISKFFDRSLHIRTKLKHLIAKEDKPLSDTKLAKKLEEQGYKVARRTVAKYRAMEGILPAYLRD